MAAVANSLTYFLTYLQSVIFVISFQKTEGQPVFLWLNLHKACMLSVTTRIDNNAYETTDCFRNYCK